ncbi:SH3 domain-containing protein [Aminobacter sp. HY435]|uniref:SH3 domain-containing protein n=1 Tax=Aminobacter sp. HY435 TaxID=2970917 RepID=UPI0022B9B76B|nr:SH3 domain-containing protein [Aminobacter sp. HY435]
MNTPAFPAVATGGTLALHGQLSSLSPSRFLASRTAVIAAGCIAAVAIVAAGSLWPATAPTDPTQTAAVPVQHATVDTTAAVSADASAGAGDTVATKQARQPAPVMREAEVLPVTTSRFENVAASGPDERTGPGSGLGTFVQPAIPSTVAGIAEGLRGSIDVQVAESEAEVAMLEASTGMIDPLASGEAAALNGPLPALRPAKAAKYANLRDGPADESNVILVVPANAAIEAETDCNWCTVVYNGQRGFMYKSLIRRSVAEEASSGQGLF